LYSFLKACMSEAAGEPASRWIDMGRTATSKLERANFLDKEAIKLKTKDPEASDSLKSLARTERRKAIKQMKRRPKKKVTRLFSR